MYSVFCIQYTAYCILVFYTFLSIMSMLYYLYGVYVMAKKKKSAEYAAELKKYKSLAKKADQRLVRLEKLSKEPGYENVLKWSYKKAMKDIKYWGGEKASRFNVKAPGRLDQLRSKIRDIEKFLFSKSSTKSSIKQVFKKRQQTYKRQYGLKLKMDDMNDFFNSEEFMRTQSLEDGYTSKTYMRAIGEIQGNEKKILDAIKKNKDVNLNIDDDLVNDAVNHLLQKYDKDVVNLY